MVGKGVYGVKVGIESKVGEASHKNCVHRYDSLRFIRPKTLLFASFTNDLGK
jgi:hypothetical protein